MTGIMDIWVYANNIINSARQMVNEELQPLKLSSAEGNILLHLLTREHLLRQEDLVEELEISKPAVSRALLSLENKGFIQRKKDPADKRVSRVFLTAKACEIGPQVKQVYEKVFSLAARGVPENEIKNTVELFRSISESFSLVRRGKKKGRKKNDFE